MNYWPK